MPRAVALAVAIVTLFVSELACSLPPVPPLQIEIPQIAVGELREEQITVPLPAEDMVAVDVRFGAGNLRVEAGSADNLLVGNFSTNVEAWRPAVQYENGRLTVQQGGDERQWGFPTGEVGRVRNEWRLAFSPQVPLDMHVRAGAGQGMLNFTGLSVVELELDLGAGDFRVQFDEPNRAQLDHLRLNAAASKVEVIGIGNARPKVVRVQGGAGDLLLDFSGAWPHSADVDITAGLGMLTLRLPQDVGVEVKVKGAATNVTAPGFTQRGDAYVNDAFGMVPIELTIHLTVGVGDVRLEKSG